MDRDGVVSGNATKPTTEKNAETTHRDSSHQRRGERQHLNGKTQQQQGYAVTTSPRENAKQHKKWDKTTEHVDDGDEDHPPTLKKQQTNNNQENENDTEKTIEVNNKHGAWGNDNRDQYNQTLQKKEAEEGSRRRRRIRIRRGRRRNNNKTLPTKSYTIATANRGKKNRRRRKKRRGIQRIHSAK